MAMEQQTYLPEQSEQLADVLSFLDAHERVHGARPATRYLLVGADEHDSVEVPASIHRALRQIVEALQAGKAVTVVPQNKLLTTQQAADLLGVSRPTVVKLIDDSVLPAETPGKRRRMVKLDDLLRYRTQRREQQYRALLETSVDYDDVEDSPEVMAEEFRRIRAEVAAKRSHHDR
ncbi:DNA binding domain-containing protein, excisionase family [Jiangella alkaliphila]|uniref:DNA binding domain-containing protein, excisionase family n=2 Tax=Jiangella alkaliphila TaxID=419479 RepID=A0A1H2LRD0_9ACTN|nr:DNA binding domain-containing protein, excisionase family [Jiangella alkaliphila]